MIAIDIENPTVLRRTLEDLEKAIPTLGGSAIPIVGLEPNATAEVVEIKLGEIIATVNLLISTLNNEKPI